MRKMRDSGIAWIGEIPTTWSIEKYKYHCNIQNGYPFESANFSSDSGFPLIRIRDISSGTTETYYNGDYPEEYVVKEGDLLIGMDGDFNIRIWSSKPALLNQRCCRILDKNNTSKHFLYYTLPFVLDEICALTYSTTVKHLSSFDILDALFPVPSLDEQRRIADYLDTKCAEIDRSMGLVRQGIDKLKEYKRSVITEAVTKGLAPDVPMKDSGVPWIGEIPETWQIKKLKNITEIERGKFTHRPRNDPRFYGGIYPFIQTGDIASAEKYITHYKQTLNDKGLSVSQLFKKGTIVMSIAANIGDIAIINFDSCFPDSIIAFKNIELINNDFLFYLLKSLKSIFIENSIISTQLNINIEIVGNIKVAVPPIHEQIKIASYLDAKCAEIDALITQKQALLDKLAEYKKSLIFECVTGKREVPA